MSSVPNVVAAIMRTDADAVRIAAANLSNADTVAYRRQLQIRHLDFPTLAPHGLAQLAEQPLPTASIALDLHAGGLRQTGEPLDAAIQGDGYFLVSTAAGEKLTRRGDFHVSDAGVLSAFTGDPVVGVEGTIQVPAGSPQIGADGTVRVGTQVVGHLQVVNVPSGAALSPRSDGLLELPAQQDASPASSVQLNPGFLETSNIQPVQEMVRMMEAVRHFEAGQRYMRAYDEMLNNGISDLGKL
jgi:flagellar basal-body rod protein FlgG